MKKYIIVCLGLALILFASCGIISNTDHQGTADNNPLETNKPSFRVALNAQWAGWTIDQTIDNSPYVFCGKCLSLPNDSSTVQPLVEFKVEKAFQGQISEEIIKCKVIGQNSFKVGESYILFAHPCASVFSDVSFQLLIDAVIGENITGAYKGCITGLSFGSLTEAVDYVEEYISEHPYNESYSLQGDYCRSSDLHEIFDYSSNVFVAEITGVMNNSFPDRTWYSFRIIDEIKGSVKDENHIVAFKDSMETGEKYLLLLRKPDDTSISFVVDSFYSILPADSEEAQTVLSFT